MDAQESQWSTKLSQNSFIPVDSETGKTGKSIKKEHEYNSDEEPEIVTAGSLLDDETEQVVNILGLLNQSLYKCFVYFEGLIYAEGWIFVRRHFWATKRN